MNIFSYLNKLRKNASATDMGADEASKQVQGEHKYDTQGYAPLGARKIGDKGIPLGAGGHYAIALDKHGIILGSDDDIAERRISDSSINPKTEYVQWLKAHLHALKSIRPLLNRYGSEGDDMPSDVVKAYHDSMLHSTNVQHNVAARGSAMAPAIKDLLVMYNNHKQTNNEGAVNE